METKYPTLKRPRRKLFCHSNKECSLKQWKEKLPLEDIDKMFDDLDPTLHDPTLHDNDDDLHPSPPLQPVSSSEQNLSETVASPVSKQEGHQTKKPPERELSPKVDGLQTPMRSPSLKENNDLDLAFKVPGPSKTSSPIEGCRVVNPVEELDSEKQRVMLPILFDCEDNGKEEETSEPLPSEKCSRDITEQPKNTDPPMPAVRDKDSLEGVHREPSIEISSCVEKNMMAFLQKLRGAAQPKPSCSRKILSPVKIPTPPEPEDDFQILEDDEPLWISIPIKNTTRKKQSRTFTSNKDSSTEKGTKGSPPETAQKPQEPEQANSMLGSHTLTQKMKKMKAKEKKENETRPKKYIDELCSPEDLPPGNLMEHEKPNKTQQVKEAPSKESDKVGKKPPDTASRKTQKENPNLKMQKKEQKSSATKTSKSLKVGNKSAKTDKSLKRGRKVMQPSGTVKEMVKDQSQEQSCDEHAESEDHHSFSDENIRNSEAEVAKKGKQNKLPVVSEEGSSEDDEIIGKRKRRQPGQWWLNSSDRTEETKATESQPTLKKSKQTNREPSIAVASPVKKNRVSTKGNQTQPVSSSSRSTSKAQDKRTKQNKNRSKRGGTPSQRTEIREVFVVNEAEQIQRQEVQDQDLDPLQSSPLAHRDHSLNSVPTSPRASREQVGPPEPGKRRKKQTGNWWIVNGMPADVENITSQPQQQKPKPHKERKKQSKLTKSTRHSTPKKGRTAASLKPPGGTPVPPLEVPPMSAPKTIKRSLAAFKDILTSAAETPAAVSSRGKGLNNRQNVAAHPAVDVAVTGSAARRGAEVKEFFRMDGFEFNSPPNQEARLSRSHSEIISGPSMIELEQYEDNDNLILPSTRVSTVLSVSDLCAPPLEPLILQPTDKANLTEWFQSLWCTTFNKTPEITPDQFDWYSYQGRAIGIQGDLNCGSICNGKILLGSYMKKPLWVDHSAVTVFNLLTSTVSVIINGRESLFSPAQSFMVPCGHAYSIRNVAAQPSVLYFTRIFSESSD